jgi:hypothetical protein
MSALVVATSHHITHHNATGIADLPVCRSAVHPCPVLTCMQVTHLSAQRQELLRREYMTPVNGAPAQPPHGFKGQLHACWTHKLSDGDARAIVKGGYTGGVHGAGSVVMGMARMVLRLCGCVVGMVCGCVAALTPLLRGVLSAPAGKAGICAFDSQSCSQGCFGWRCPLIRVKTMCSVTGWPDVMPAWCPAVFDSWFPCLGDPWAQRQAGIGCKRGGAGAALECTLCHTVSVGWCSRSSIARIVVIMPFPQQSSWREA